MSGAPPANDGHEAAPPAEAEARGGHTPEQQVQPPDADAVDLYGEQ